MMTDASIHVTSDVNSSSKIVAIQGEVSYLTVSVPDQMGGPIPVSASVVVRAWWRQLTRGAGIGARVARTSRWDPIRPIGRG